MLDSAGFEICDEGDRADAIIINTCAFIEDARKEAVETIFAGINWKNEGDGRRLFVIGCLPQRYPDELAKELPEVDGFFHVGDYQGVFRAVAGQPFNGKPGITGKNFTPSHYRYLRIADGCDRSCTYCAIPHIRGKYQSRPLHEIVTEAESLAEAGAKELIVIAQEVNGYGSDLPGDENLSSLLREVNKVDGVKWLRLLYLHPPAFSEELLGLFAGIDKLLPYFDFPIEHISDCVLRRMGRRINRAQIEHWIRRIREEVPESVLRTTVMVGFPGETEDDFYELADFIADTRFDRLGVFTYSPEEGTPAYKYNEGVDVDTAEIRLEQLLEIQREISLERGESFIGKTVKVLVDECENGGRSIGRTIFDAPEIDGVVHIAGKIQPGEFIKVVILDADEFDLFGEMTDE